MTRKGNTLKWQLFSREEEIHQKKNPVRIDPVICFDFLIILYDVKFSLLSSIKSRI